MESVSAFFRRHWRIVTVTSIGAVLAFVGSFLVDPTYTSSTLLLIRGRDATFLTSTGEDLSSQPGVVDSTLAQSLAATYAGIATSREVALTVVDDLALGEGKKDSGMLSAVAGGFAWVYRCGRAVITAGYCADVDPHEQAVVDVLEGIAVAPLGTNAGSSAGTTGSYVLEVQATGRTSDEARRVTDAVADQLVRLSGERFEGDSSDNIANLEQLVADAETEVAQQNTALAAFQTANGLVAADGQQALSVSTYEGVKANLIAAQAQQADLEAQLSAIDAALKASPETLDSTQSITTGRSTTEVDSQVPNSVHADLEVQQSTLQAQLDGQAARVTQLQATLDEASFLADNAVLAELSTLENNVALAQADVTDLSGKLQDARVTQAQGPVDLSRIDEAAAPPYPSEPKRYLYLALGLIVGALAGIAMTAQARRRAVTVGRVPDESEAPDVSAAPDASEALDASEASVGKPKTDFDLVVAGLRKKKSRAAVLRRQEDADGQGADHAANADKVFLGDR